MWSVSDAGAVNLLRRLRDSWNAGNSPLICLFKNNIVPGEFTDLVDLQIADFNGYPAAVGAMPGGIVADSWASLPALQPDGRAGIRNNPVIFSKAAGGTANTIYGWALIGDDGAGNPLYYLAQNLLGGPVTTVDGTQIPIWPVFTGFHDN